MNPNKRTLLTFLLASLLVLNVGSAIVRAQEQTGERNAASDDSNRVTPGRELAHQSREAAGEEKDEMEEFKQSASVHLISQVTGLNLQQSYWLSVVLNFAAIAAIIIWAGRKYLPGIFRDRTAAIQKAMQEAQKASEEARRKLAEIESRLQKLDVEIGMMRDGTSPSRLGVPTRDFGTRYVSSFRCSQSAMAGSHRRLSQGPGP